MLATYGGEAREILYGDIRNVALLRSRLNRSIKIKLILKDNTAVLLEAAAARPLRQMHDLMRQRIAPESSPAAPQAYEHYRTCCRCGNIYTGGAACPACGFKRLSPALAAFFSLVFPGLGQLYVGQIILGTIFIACQIVTLCFAYIYIYQWIGRLHETAAIIVVQAALNILDSMIKAYAAAHELNA
jgi:TM2 domain-containing membrane protein YozV